MTVPSSRRILVLDAECNAATCVVQSLGRAGHAVHLAGLSDGAFSFRSRHVSRSFRYHSPLKSRSAFLEWFSDHLERERYDHILPLSTMATPIQAASRTRVSAAEKRSGGRGIDTR